MFLRADTKECISELVEMLEADECDKFDSLPLIGVGKVFLDKPRVPQEDLWDWINACGSVLRK